MVWEAVFLLVVLKIPIAYMCLVVWWAIRAEPRPGPDAAGVAVVSPTDDGSCDWRRGHRRRGRRPVPPPRPAGRPVRTAYARAEAPR